MAKTFQDVTDIYFSYPEKLYEPELVTVLKARVDTRKPFKISPDRWATRPQRQGKWFHYKVYRCPSIRELTELKQYLSECKDMFMVAGLPVTELDPKKAQHRKLENFRDRPTQYMTLDFDSIDVGMTEAEMLASPTKAIKLLWHSFAKKVKHLPAELPQSVWTLSSSYGKPGEGFNGHAAIVLKDPATLGQIKYWFSDLKEKTPDLLPDPVTARLNQPLYTAAPMLVMNKEHPDQPATRALFKKLKGLKRQWALLNAEPLDTKLLFLEEDQVEKNIIASTAPSDSALFDYVIEQLSLHGWLKAPEPREGKYWDVHCPWEAEHSGDTGDSATTLISPDKRHPPGFRCQHANTHDGQGHGFHWFLDELVKEGVLDRSRLRDIYQQAAREEFQEDEEEENIFLLTVAELQERYVYVKDSKEMYDTKTRDTIGMETFRLYHQKVYQQKNHIGTDKRPLNGVQAWSMCDNKFSGGVSVDSVGWYPGKHDPMYTYNGASYVNTWKESHIEPRKGNIDIFLEHIDFIFPDEGQADIFLDFVAHTFQKPWERPSWAVLHVSQYQGLGRGQVHTLISSLLGRAGGNVSLVDMIDKPYNGYMFQTVWAGIEEVSGQATKLGAERLKEIITTLECNINDKYMPFRYNVPVFTRFFFMTNNADAIAIEDGERRYWVCGPCLDQYKPKDAEYYKNLAQTFQRADFKAAVLHYFMNRDISKFNAGMCPAATVLKDRMVLMSKSPVDDAIAHIVADEENYPAFGTPKHVIHWVSQRVEDEGTHVTDRTHAEINRKIKKMPYVGGLNKNKSQGRTYRVNGHVARFRVFRDVNKWAFEKVSTNMVVSELEKYSMSDFDS